MNCSRSASRVWPQRRRGDAADGRARLVFRAPLFALVFCAAASAQPTVDELLDLNPPRPDKADEPAKPAGVPIDPGVARRLTGEEAADAFKQAILQMDEAAARLGEIQDAGLDTQRIQEAIVNKLAMIIDAATPPSGGSGQPNPEQDARQQDTGSQGNQQQAAGQQGDAGQNPSQGGASNPPPPPGGERTGMIEEERREWGNLPPRIRDELIQSSTERFSPVYRAMTEAYYQRLAEEGR